jgi:hypothetical protein
MAVKKLDKFSLVIFLEKLCTQLKIIWKKAQTKQAIMFEELADKLNVESLKLLWNVKT